MPARKGSKMTVRPKRDKANDVRPVGGALRSAKPINAALKTLVIAAEPPINNNPADLDPTFRSKLDAALAQLSAQGSPFRFVEGFRTLDRQQWLYGSTSACVVLICAGCTCGESEFSRFLGRNFHNCFRISRVLMQAVHDRRGREKVVKCQVDLGALRNANEWTGYLKCFIFLGECVDLQARTRVGFRVPIALAEFEVESQHTFFKFSGGCAIGVGLNDHGNW
jgi:hypothetical protein